MADKSHQPPTSELRERLTLTTKSDLAECFGVSTTTVDNWLRRGAPHVKRGRGYEFCIPDVIAWTRRSSGEPESEKRNPEQERARKDAALADRYELEAAELRGELAYWRQVLEQAGQIVINIRSILSSLGVKTAAAHAEYGGTPREHQAITDRSVAEALGYLADGGALVGLPGAVSPAAPKNGERVGGQQEGSEPRGKRRARKVEH